MHFSPVNRQLNGLESVFWHIEKKVPHSAYKIYIIHKRNSHSIYGIETIVNSRCARENANQNEQQQKIYTNFFFALSLSSVHSNEIISILLKLLMLWLWIYNIPFRWAIDVYVHFVNENIFNDFCMKLLHLMKSWESNSNHNHRRKYPRKKIIKGKSGHLLVECFRVFISH